MYMNYSNTVEPVQSDRLRSMFNIQVWVLYRNLGSHKYYIYSGLTFIIKSYQSIQIVTYMTSHACTYVFTDIA